MGDGEVARRVSDRVVGQVGVARRGKGCGDGVVADGASDHRSGGVADQNRVSGRDAGECAGEGWVGRSVLAAGVVDGDGKRCRRDGQDDGAIGREVVAIAGVAEGDRIGADGQAAVGGVAGRGGSKRRVDGAEDRFAEAEGNGARGGWIAARGVYDLGEGLSVDLSLGRKRELERCDKPAGAGELQGLRAVVRV